MLLPSCTARSFVISSYCSHPFSDLIASSPPADRTNERWLGSPLQRDYCAAQSISHATNQPLGHTPSNRIPFNSLGRELMKHFVPVVHPIQLETMVMLSLPVGARFVESGGRPKKRICEKEFPFPRKIPYERRRDDETQTKTLKLHSPLYSRIFRQVP